MKRGQLVVFEGVDGAGKSTQLERLADRWGAADVDVVRTREPYDCEAGRRIRAMARSGDAVAPETELAWFEEQREVHVREVVAPALARGAVVLSDRYFLSTVAYQGARGLDGAAILRASEERFPIPDLALWFDLPADAGLARVARRGGPAEPVFEQAGFLARVNEEYAAISRPWFIRIAAEGSSDEVAARVAAALEAHLPEIG